MYKRRLIYKKYDKMTRPNILYKYKSFSANSLSILINKELYFASPEKLNDPYDCRIDIVAALESAVELAGKKTNKDIKTKLEKLKGLNHIFKKIEHDIQSTGILSLSRLNKNILMWSHYADEHRGFCLGFQLSKDITDYNMDNRMVASDDVIYSADNPFLEYFIKFAENNNIPKWDDFWPLLIQIGLQSKSKPWKYEKEVRIIRKEPGIVPFKPAELSEVIYGLNMSEENRLTVQNLLSGAEWKHVRLKEMIKKGHKYNLYIKKIKKNI